LERIVLMEKLTDFTSDGFGVMTNSGNNLHPQRSGKMKVTAISMDNGTVNDLTNKFWELFESLQDSVEIVYGMGFDFELSPYGNEELLLHIEADGGWKIFGKTCYGNNITIACHRGSITVMADTRRHALRDPDNTVGKVFHNFFCDCTRDGDSVMDIITSFTLNKKMLSTFDVVEYDSWRTDAPWWKCDLSPYPASGKGWKMVKEQKMGKMNNRHGEKVMKDKIIINGDYDENFCLIEGNRAEVWGQNYPGSKKTRSYTPHLIRITTREEAIKLADKRIADQKAAIDADFAAEKMRQNREDQLTRLAGDYGGLALTAKGEVEDQYGNYLFSIPSEIPSDVGQWIKDKMTAMRDSPHP